MTNSYDGGGVSSCDASYACGSCGVSRLVSYVSWTEQPTFLNERVGHLLWSIDQAHAAQLSCAPSSKL